MRRIRTIAAVVLALVSAAWGDAAAQAPVLPLPAADQQQLTNVLGAGVVGQALPCQPITDPTALFPLQPRSRTYQLTSGANAGTTEVLTLSQARARAACRRGDSVCRRCWRASSKTSRNAGSSCRR